MKESTRNSPAAKEALPRAFPRVQAGTTPGHRAEQSAADVDIPPLEADEMSEDGGEPGNAMDIVPMGSLEPSSGDQIFELLV